MQVNRTTVFCYVEAAIGGAQNRNKVLTVEEFKPNGYADCYRSMFRFPEAFRAYVTYNEGSVEGYAGESKADFFAADFDHKKDPNKALEDARRTVRRWEAVYGLPAEALRYYYSGSKGIHLEVPETLFGGLEPGRDTAGRLKALALEMLKESETADSGIYNTTRLWRAPNTKHRKTNLYKIPLYSHEFFNFSIEEIRKLAQAKRDSFVYTDPAEFESVADLERLWRESRDRPPEERREYLDTAAVLDGVDEGDRDNLLFKFVCKLRGAGVPRDWAERLVKEAAANCNPAFSEREAVRKVENAYSRYQPNDTTLLGADNGASPSPSLNRVGTQGRKPTVTKFTHMKPPGPRRYLLRELVLASYVTLLHGDGGVAKSLLALALAIAVAGDRPRWLGRDVENGPVLYLDFELDAEEQARRVYQLCRGAGLDKPPEQLFYMSALGCGVREAFETALETCREHAISLVILDSLGPALQGDAEAARDVIGFHQNMLEPFRTEGVAVFIIDHQSRLQAGERYQGKSAFGSVYKTNLARSVIQAEATERGEGTLTVRLRHKKHNFGPLVEPFGIRLTFSEEKVTLDRVELDAADLAEESTLNATDRVKLSLENGPAYPWEIAEYTGLAIKTVKNALSGLRKQQVVEATGEVDRRTEQVRLCVPASLRIKRDGDGDGSKSEAMGGLWEGAL